MLECKSLCGLSFAEEQTTFPFSTVPGGEHYVGKVYLSLENLNDEVEFVKAVSSVRFQRMSGKSLFGCHGALPLRVPERDDCGRSREDQPHHLLLRRNEHCWEQARLFAANRRRVLCPACCQHFLLCCVRHPGSGSCHLVSLANLLQQVPRQSPN